jgi:hypothetical protein
MVYVEVIAMVLMAWIWWALIMVGYKIRPYDMLADHRRWFWQPRMRCGWPS